MGVQRAAARAAGDLAAIAVALEHGVLVRRQLGPGQVRVGEDAFEAPPARLDRAAAAFDRVFDERGHARRHHDCKTRTDTTAEAVEVGSGVRTHLDLGRIHPAERVGRGVEVERRRRAGKPRAVVVVGAIERPGDVGDEAAQRHRAGAGDPLFLLLAVADDDGHERACCQPADAAIAVGFEQQRRSAGALALEPHERQRFAAADAEAGLGVETQIGEAEHAMQATVGDGPERGAEPRVNALHRRHRAAQAGIEVVRVGFRKTVEQVLESGD